MVVSCGPDDGRGAVPGEREARSECAAGGRACGRQLRALLTITGACGREEPGGTEGARVVRAADERGVAVGGECDAGAEGAGAGAGLVVRRESRGLRPGLAAVGEY